MSKARVLARICIWILLENENFQKVARHFTDVNWAFIFISSRLSLTRSKVDGSEISFNFYVI